MRIVAGRWRGRGLKAPPGGATRPTTDRVRESLFSILGTVVEGAEVLDLFCGSGALGLEALSRGAARAVFVDSSTHALAVVRENLATVGAEAERWRVTRGDATAHLRRLLKDAMSPPLLVLADPPYGAEDLAVLCDVAAAGPRRILRLVIEHAAGEGTAPPAGWRLDRRRYGRTELSILEPTS